MSGGADLGQLVLKPMGALHATRTWRLRDGARYVVTNLARRKHVAVRPDVYRLLGLIDGRRKLVDIYRSRAAGLPELEALPNVIRQLQAAELIAAVGAELPPVPKAKPPVEAGLLFWKKELVELAPLLPALDRIAGWIFSGRGLAVLVALFAVAGWRFAAGDGGAVDAFGWLTQLGPDEAFAFALLFWGLKALHELGHALAFKRLAGDEGIHIASVRAGVATMFLMPFPYTDVSGAWQLSSPWRRAAIGAAGMYVEAWIAAIALLVWSGSDSGFVATLCSQIVTLTLVTTLIFNLNPFGRMDGYYILADLLGRPNLQQQSTQAALGALGNAAGLVPEEKRSRTDRGMLAFWIGSFLYRVGLYAGLVWIAWQFAPALALFVILFAGSLLIVRPLIRTAQALANVGGDKAKATRRIAVYAGGVALLTLIPLPAPILMEGVVERPQAQAIFAPRDATLSADGRTIRSEALVHQIAAASAERDLALSQWQRALIEAPFLAPRLAAETATLDNLLARLKAQAEALALGGRVETTDLDDYRGGLLPMRRDLPYAVKGGGPLRIRAVASEEARDSLVAGLAGRARPAGDAGDAFDIRIATVAPEATTRLPSPALGRRGGGTIEVSPADFSGRRAAAPLVEIVADPVGDHGELRIGQRVEVRMPGPWRSLAERAVRGILGMASRRADIVQ